MKSLWGNHTIDPSLFPWLEKLLTHRYLPDFSDSTVNKLLTMETQILSSSKLFCLPIILKVLKWRMSWLLFLQVSAISTLLPLPLLPRAPALPRQLWELSPTSRPELFSTTLSLAVMAAWLPTMSGHLWTLAMVTAALTASTTTMLWVILYLFTLLFYGHEIGGFLRTKFFWIGTNKQDLYFTIQSNSRLAPKFYVKVFIYVCSRSPVPVFPIPKPPALASWLVTPLMVIQCSAMLPTVLVSPWSHVGPPIQRPQPTSTATSTMTQMAFKVAPATLTRPTATPSLMVPMVTSWSPPTTTCPTTMQDPRWPPSVDLPLKNPIGIFNGPI